jgi:hypothetical protein
MSLGETVVWLTGVGALIWLFTRGGTYRIVAIVGLVIGGALATRRFERQRTRVQEAERKAADTFSVNVAPRMRERRRRLTEARKAREEIRKLEEQYVADQKDRTRRVADLWNQSFGRQSSGGGDTD